MSRLAAVPPLPQPQRGDPQPQPRATPWENTPAAVANRALSEVEGTCKGDLNSARPVPVPFFLFRSTLRLALPKKR